MGLTGHSQAHVLEPSAGEGVFLEALREVASESGCDLTMTGVECSPGALHAVTEQRLLEPARAICSDFLAVTPFPVQAVIGNPPYVRLRHAPADEAERALRRAEEALGEKMDPSGSVWMPFVLHACQFLTPGGRLAYVLPYDLTYRRYARVLWDFLGKHFGGLRVVRGGERMFPDLLQEAILLYADDYGESTGTIRYDVFDTRAQFLEGKPILHEDIPLADVVAGEKCFIEALLGDELRQLLRDVVEPATVPIADLATIRIGYVAGDKSFFHPSKELIAEYGIAPASLRPALTSSRRLARKGIWTSRCERDHLFFPGAGELGAGELVQGSRGQDTDGGHALPQARPRPQVLSAAQRPIKTPYRASGVPWRSLRVSHSPTEGRTMSATLQFDEDASRRVERIYTTPDVIEQRQTILRALALQPGERAIDIGSGPGLLACEMAVAVGAGGRICGVDVSENMLALARARRPPAGSGPIEYQEAGAHTLPYADASFDVAVCTQVYEYVDDVPAALLELGRVLRPGGRALVLDTDWDSIVWASSNNERMDRVLAGWEEHLVHPHLPRTLTRLLRDAGLEVTDRQIVPLFNAGYDPNTYSAGMLELIATFVPDRNGVSEAEATAWAQDLTELGPNYFLSLNRYLFLAHKPT